MLLFQSLIPTDSVKNQKEGGRYASKIGNARTIDQAENRIIFTDGESVPVKDMYSVVFIEE